MAQPPSRGVMARGLFRSVPFVTPKIFVQSVAIGGSVSAEFDTLEGFADVNQFNGSAAFPGTDTPKQKAVGPLLDAGVFADRATLLRVEFAIDRGCSYRAIAPDTAIGVSTWANISGLRVTARFVRVTLFNNDGANAVNVEFGVYMRSA